MLLTVHTLLHQVQNDVENTVYTVTSGTDSDAGSEAGAMIRQGSKLSYGSNDSGGSGSSAGAPKVRTSVESLLSVSIPHCLFGVGIACQ